MTETTLLLLIGLTPIALGLIGVFMDRLSGLRIGLWAIPAVVAYGVAGKVWTGAISAATATLLLFTSLAVYGIVTWVMAKRKTKK